MRILILGSGGVGGFVGSRLVETGQNVTFVARGPHLHAIRDHGLCMLSETGTRQVHKVNAVERPEDAGSEFDLIIFAVKCYDTQPAAQLLRPALSEQTAVLTLQNGIDSVPTLSSILGATARHRRRHLAHRPHRRTRRHRVSGRRSPSRHRRTRRPNLRPRSDHRPGSTRLRHPTEVTDDIDYVLWNKLVLLSVLGAISAACQLPLGPIIATQGMLDLFRTMFNEAVAVARAQGIALPDSTSTDLIALLQSLPPDNTTSLQVDFAHQRRVELDYTTGAVLRRAHQNPDIPTPTLQTLYLTLKARAQSFGGL